MTQDSNDKMPIPSRQKVKSGSCIPRVDLSEEVADDLRRFIFDLIDTKQWANRSDRELAGDIINADEKGTELARFYTMVEGERKRLSFDATRRLLKTYRSRTLEIFKDDLVPYLQEAIVEVIKTAGSKPANLKIILDALGVGKEPKDAKSDEPDTPSSAYLKIPKGMGDARERLEANVPERTGAVTSGLRTFGYEGLMRDDFIKRKRPPTGVVSGRDDPGMDEPANVIEVDGGPYSYPTKPSEDDLFNYGREYLGDTEQPEYSDSDELGGAATDESSDEESEAALYGE